MKTEILPQAFHSASILFKLNKKHFQKYLNNWGIFTTSVLLKILL